MVQVGFQILNSPVQPATILQRSFVFIFEGNMYEENINLGRCKFQKCINVSKTSQECETALTLEHNIKLFLNFLQLFF